MDIYKIIDIAEQDFGCEERPENEQYSVDVKLQNCKSNDIIIISYSDSLLYKQHMDVGSIVSYDGKNMELSQLI